MQRKTLSFLAFLSVTLLSVVSAQAETWYWTEQADSSNWQAGTQDAVDRNANISPARICLGSRMAFGNIRV